MLRLLRLLFVLHIIAFSLSFSSCSGGKVISASDEYIRDDKKARTGTDDEKLESLFIDGCKARVMGDTEAALNYFQSCRQIDPNNAAVLFEIAKIYYEFSRLTDAKELAERSVKLDPDNKFYPLLYGEILAYLTQFEDAADVYKGLAQKYPDDLDNFLQWAYMLEKSGRIPESIEVLNAVEAQFGEDESILREKQRLYMQIGKVEEAANEVQKLIALSGDDPYYYGILAQLYEVSGQEEKAEAIYRKLMEMDDSRPELLLQIAEFHKKNGQTDQYFEDLFKAFANPEIDIDRKVIILVPYIDSMGMDFRSKKQVLQLNQLLIEAHPKDPKSHALYGDFLYFEERKADAREQYLSSLKLHEGVFEVWKKIFFIDADLREYDSLAVVSGKAIELFPNQPLSYFFQGFAFNQLSESEKAVKVLKKALPMTIGNDALKADIYSNLGDAYHSLQKFKESDEAYDKCLELDPDNIFVLNNFSYYLSLRNDKLEEALTMSERANQLAPNNSSFQDTYAWILYKLGRYEETLSWLEKAMLNGGSESGVILDHYGDVLYKLGRVDEAVEYWIKARNHNVESDFIDKKISDRKLYE